MTAICRFLKFFFAARFLGGSFGIRDVVKHLHSTGILFGGEDAILLVDGNADERLELARKFAVAGADVSQQLSVAIEDLEAVFKLIGHPDVSVSVDCDAFRPGEVPWSVAMPTVV